MTEVNAAKSMPIAYISIIGLMLVPCPTLKLAIDDKTRTKTKIGATDLSALMNKSPNKLKYGATFGNTTATPIPKIMAIIIRETKLKRIKA